MPHAKAPIVVDQLPTDATATLNHAVDALLAEQAKLGYWCGELEGDSILQSEYILMKWILEQEDDSRIDAIVRYLRKQQQSDGAWVQYPGAKADISATVKAYFCLKLVGDSPDEPHMKKAREVILAAGGAETCNSFSKFYLAALGQIKYDAVPSIPPEIIYLPKWSYFHLDKVSAWTRTMITPLSIVTSCKPVRKVSEEKGISELYCCQKIRHKLIAGAEKHRGWSTVFFSMDRILKLIERAGLTPLRKRALKRIEQWILDHTERSEGMGAIFPPMVYIQIALRCRGYAADHPKMVQAAKQLDDLMIHDIEKDEIRIQPCFSPVWDTGIAAYALTECNLGRSHPAIERCVRWLLEKECKQPGDWVANVKEKVEPSGWFFEYDNGFYPDVDDTAMVAMALYRLGGDDAIAAAKRGVAWVLAMQNDDGGWAAFDRTVERPILEHVPFADHNAIQDPSCPDIAGRTLECLGHLGYDASHPKVKKAIDYIFKQQDQDGSWWGRWGINYVYGTWQVLCGLKSVNFDMSNEKTKLAAQWLKTAQHADGSFGESANSYEDIRLKGQGPATPSQTAWGAMGMMTVFGPNDPDVQRAIKWLCQTQLKEPNSATQDRAGSWQEPWFTGTGFPKVFYLRYHLYRLYFPVMALGRWLKELEPIETK